MNVIRKDGTTVTVATKKDINNMVSLHADRNAEGQLKYFYATDKKITVTLDLRDGTTSVSPIEDDYSSRKSFSEGLSMKSKSFAGSTRGTQRGGWALTSNNGGNGPESDATKGYSGTINVDEILPAFGAKGKSLSLPDIKEPLGKAELLNAVKEGIEVVKELIEERDASKSQSDGSVCHYCKQERHGMDKMDVPDGKGGFIIKQDPSTGTSKGKK